MIYFFLIFRLVFVVGKSNKRVDNLLIADEAKYFGDIVQVKYTIQLIIFSFYFSKLAYLKLMIVYYGVDLAKPTLKYFIALHILTEFRILRSW